MTLTNEDEEVAIATGSIAAGDYEFQLTVTDSSGQQSSEKLTVTVKKGLTSYLVDHLAVSPKKTNVKKKPKT